MKRNVDSDWLFSRHSNFRLALQSLPTFDSTQHIGAVIFDTASQELYYGDSVEWKKVKGNIPTSPESLCSWQYIETISITDGENPLPVSDAELMISMLVAIS